MRKKIKVEPKKGENKFCFITLYCKKETKKESSLMKPIFSAPGCQQYVAAQYGALFE